ncbi:MAG: (2Fe-2S)-binding protein [Fimbriimonadaceae bacterium]|nr:(2Fe-2S)-binding protein [Fimbriimonadaceae bacterium]
MARPVRVRVNGRWTEAIPTETVAALLERLGLPARRSLSGEPRSVLCGMGICHECRVTLDGDPHRRACLALCRDGMEVRTDG